MAEIYNDTPDTLLSGTNSADTIKNGGYGDDIWHVGGSRVTIDAKNGDDYIWNLRGGSQSSINAGAGNDNIENEAAKNVTINGGKGNDTIDNALMFDGAIGRFRYPDDVIIIGGTGNDLIYNNSGSNVTIIGGTGNDTIINKYGENVLFQYANGDGNDYIEGFNETSTLSIGGGSYSTIKSGDDLIITVGEGKISLMGAANLDTLNIQGVKKSSSKTLTLTDSSAAAVTIGSAIKTVKASKRTTAIKIKGNSLDNSILSGKGNDTIYGGEGKDTISGGVGNDKLLGGSGNDSLSGGDGADTLSGGSGDDKLLGGAGNDSLSGGDGKDTLSGGSGDDKLLGGNGNDSLSGGNGKDTLSGGANNDKLYGGSGNDCIKGGSGNDSLWGGTGNDSLWGDAGNDKLYGGEGKDIFIYKPGEGTDTIFDYQSGDMLKILKSDGKAGGTFTSSSFKNNKLTLAIDGGGKVIFDGVIKSDQININGTIHTISGTKLK